MHARMPETQFKFDIVIDYQALCACVNLREDQVRILERSLGSAQKTVAENEKDTYVVQRRCLRAARNIEEGEILTEDMIEILRPATPGALMSWDLEQAIGMKARTDLPFGKDLRWTDLEE